MAQFVAKSTLAAYYRCLNQFQFTDAALIMKASLVLPLLAPLRSLLPDFSTLRSHHVSWMRVSCLRLSF